MLRCCVDTGGTFADVVLYDPESGCFEAFKVPATPAEPWRALADALDHMEGVLGIDPAAVGLFAHGTTIATNALVEEALPPTALFITRGFRAVQEMGDQTRGYGPATFDLGFEKPRPVAPQRLTFEVDERVDAAGAPVRAPAEEDLRRLARALPADVRSAAVCLLFSFLHPDHERAVARVLGQERPDVAVSLSSAVLPRIREHVRLSTTVLNAALSPLAGAYFRSLDALLDRRCPAAQRRFAVQSNGGVTSFQRAAERPVAVVLSGPAAGAMAGAHLARQAGWDRVVTFDMGGTSCDVCLIEDARPLEKAESTVAGRVVGVPALDIETVSAGGGTVAWVDGVGDLRLGPRSAGAVPGPACYGRGGTEATVTDVDLHLGLLNPAALLDGRMRLDAGAAAAAVGALAGRLGVPALRAAWGVFLLINQRMARAIQSISTNRGRDLRDFCLLAFGGAGPVHGPAVAVDLGIPRVLVPAYPGLTSAMGLLCADLRHDFVRSHLHALDAGGAAEAVNRDLAELQEAARRELRSSGLRAEEVSWRRALDLRYAGQGYEMAVPLPRFPLQAADLPGMRAAFDRLHRQRFGHHAPEQPVQVVSHRLTAVLPGGLEPPGRTPAAATWSAASRRSVVWGGQAAADWPVHRREDVPAGLWATGPLIVEQADSTVVVPPGCRVCADGGGNLLIETAVGTPGKRALGTHGQTTAGTPGERAAGTPGERVAGTRGETAAGTRGERAAGTHGQTTAGTRVERAAGTPGETAVGTHGQTTAGTRGERAAGTPGETAAGNGGA